MHSAHESVWPGVRPPPEPTPAVECASCGGSRELRAYGAALFCADCREMAEEFYRKDLYCDYGGGD